MQVNVTANQAIVPKARGMYAKRLNALQYDELMRRRSVPELAALLKQHPYFKNSLSTLSTKSPNRTQVEYLLNMDIFLKYKSLLRYNFSGDGFAGYYLRELELNEILKALRFISTNSSKMYITQIPDYLVKELHIDLFELARAANFADALKALKNSPYFKLLKNIHEQDKNLDDFAACEAALVSKYYSDIIESINEAFADDEKELIEKLFLQEIEVYNLEVIYRVKTYYPTAFTAKQLNAFLIPFTFKISKAKLNALVNAPLLQNLPPQYQNNAGNKNAHAPLPEILLYAGKDSIYEYAKKLLHISPSPMATLAAFICLAKLERENVVNVVEGVRYSLKSEDIRALLKI
jgi:V/A-type H+-transporting ATPase subunit C